MPLNEDDAITLAKQVSVLKRTSQTALAKQISDITTDLSVQEKNAVNIISQGLLQIPESGNVEETK